LRAALDANAWLCYGDLGQQAMAAWLQLICGPNLLLRESVERRVDALKGELAGPEPSPLEKLLVERVVACWLQCHYADGTYAQATGPQVTPAARQELMKRQESSQRRYLASIKQLALVRKLLRPAVSPLRLAMDPVPEAPVDRRGRATARAG